MVLLRVRDEDGVVGLGEAVPLALRGGVSLAEVVRELEGLAAEHRGRLQGAVSARRGARWRPR